MLKDQNEALMKNTLYTQHEAIFNNHLSKISNFSKDFDPTSRMMEIAEDMASRGVLA